MVIRCFLFPLNLAMIPEYWLTEGGQSATGALLDYMIESHVASPRLANHAASQSKKLTSVPPFPAS